MWQDSKFRPFFYVTLYGAWVACFRLLSLTVIAYFSISPTSRFQDISEAFSSNEVTLMGLSAFLFVGLSYWLNPMTTTPLSALFKRIQIERNFLPSFIQGALIAGGIVLVFVLSGAYLYLGYFIQFDEAPLALTNVLARTLTVATLAYCETWIFQERLTQYLKKIMPRVVSIQCAALLYCCTKILQFDLGIMHLVSLYLLFLATYFRIERQGSFARGAGFLAGIWVVFHPLFSLPIFGNDFSGIFLIKYQSSLSYTVRILTGGAGGPISSLVFQGVLILDIGRSILRQKKVSEYRKVS